MKIALFTVFTFLFTNIASADSARVVDVTSSKVGSKWTFNVTLEHRDTGWEHYADGWGVYLPDGTELGYRLLAHPHLNEQPFTRSLSGVKIPKGEPVVIIKPRDLVHGVGEGVEHKLR